MIIAFTSGNATLEVAGGKGANLARLKRAGFDVPPGFILSTAAYRAFVDANALAQGVAEALVGVTANDLEALEQAADRIRAAFSRGRLSADLSEAIRQAYAGLSSSAAPEPATPVAVRSSATAEDLPDLSFAGQQDTYLNIVGGAAVLKAVVDCWSSLWTARAIGYRLRNEIAHDTAALAVVVQAMVPSEVSGVLFTANPLTGLRSEMVIDATFGLGEALVSGQVEPDHFVLDGSSGQCLSQTLGAKALATRARAGGGVESVSENAAGQQTLSGAQLVQLAALGRAIQAEYQAPQDIEWAFARGQLYVLQSRAITSLFPLPRLSYDPLIVWVAFGALQGLVGPLTPLGLDTILNVSRRAGRLVGIDQPLNTDVFGVAGERLWMRFSDVIRHPVGSRLLSRLLQFGEPGAAQILKGLAADPRLGAGTGRVKLSALRRIGHFVLPVLARLGRNLLRPDHARARFEADLDARLRTASIAPAGDRFGRLANVVAFIRERVGDAFPLLLPRFFPTFLPGVAGLAMLGRLSQDPGLTLAVTRSLPHNVTTEMDLALWGTAQAIAADAPAAAAFRDTDAPALAQRYLNQQLPAVAQAAVARFMERYGMRGVGEIDLGQPRWRDDPTPLMHTLKSYLQVDPRSAPDVVFAKGEQAAQAAIEQLAAAVRRQRGGWLKEKVARAAARRVRLLMGARESPKFFIIRIMGIARQALLAAGQEFAAAGTIDRADDVMFLKLGELEALAQTGPRPSPPAAPTDLKPLIAARRATYARELRRRQVPRVLLSDGRAFYEGVGAATDTGQVITGSAVSPGVAEGMVQVVFDPRGVALAPGAVLVCPGTDPAWTPLFMAASALVTEVGGMMTHGSVVAREYGIPAVVGVHEATSRLKNGQRVRVDGTQGKIEILE
jgi:rifampicin phosphotransferase